MSTQPRHPIGLVCRRTGLKPDLIRAWESRYGAVRPGRSETRRRLYSDADIDRLKLLRQAVSAGRGIRHVATLSREELVDLITDDAADIGYAAPPPAEIRIEPTNLERTLEEITREALEATADLDGQRLARLLDRAAAGMSRVALLDRLIAPLMQEIGERWHRGDLRPIHEHLASAVIRSFLGALSTRTPSPRAPHLLATTPAGQVHEIGALLAARCAADNGWQTTYLGPDLPAEEIAGAAQKCAAKVVALGVTFPPDDPNLGDELRRLRDLLGEDVVIIVGGRAASAYSDALREIGARRIESLTELRGFLAR